jgi:hypothetical protein
MVIYEPLLGLRAGSPFLAATRLAGDDTVLSSLAF